MNRKSPTLAIVTHLASPYQVEFFDAISTALAGRLWVIYLYSSSPSRSWDLPLISHNHILLDTQPDGLAKAISLLSDCTLAIFNVYNHFSAQTLLRHRVRRNRPWCFWGERPGSSGMKTIGSLYRRLLLAPLHRSRVPIWGIGNFALERYRQEFGSHRKYVNLPYFSNLARFSALPRPIPSSGGDLSFLFSGSLIHRKGVDLIAMAFLKLAAKHPNVSLHFIGKGPLEGDLRRLLEPVLKRVTFHGFIGWNELPISYSIGRVLCVPSRYDGWGLVVPEGLASGLPVIASNQTGAAVDLLKPGENGWLCDAGSADSLFNAMANVVSLSRPQLDTASQNARLSIANHHLDDGVRRFMEAVDISTS